MINAKNPFKVLVVIPGQKQAIEALLTCLFEDGETIVEIGNVTYHAVVNKDSILELSDNASDKFVNQTAIEAISYLK